VRARPAIAHRRLDRALTALAVLCVLMMPVEYRGGAEASHAHAVFQFWASEGVGALDHHGHDHETVTSRADSLAVGGWLAPITGAESPATATDAPPDTPRLSEFTVAAERAVGMAVAVSAALALLSLVVLRLLPIASVRIPLGLTPAPEAPPPRGATSFSFTPEIG
jgi:hypothetical protein